MFREAVGDVATFAGLPVWRRQKGRTTAEPKLADGEREALERWSRRAKCSQALAQRCRIVLGCADGKTNQQVAADLGIWP